MNTYIFHPDGPGPHPVVIHYMDPVGVREELSDMCRRLASVGYCLLMPSLHYRKVRHVDLDADRLRDPAYAGQLIDHEPAARSDRIARCPPNTAGDPHPRPGPGLT